MTLDIKILKDRFQFISCKLCILLRAVKPLLYLRCRDPMYLEECEDCRAGCSLYRRADRMTHVKTNVGEKLSYVEIGGTCLNERVLTACLHCALCMFRIDRSPTQNRCDLLHSQSSLLLSFSEYFTANPFESHFSFIVRSTWGGSIRATNYIKL